MLLKLVILHRKDQKNKPHFYKIIKDNSYELSFFCEMSFRGFRQEIFISDYDDINI
mgnify:CR=1 FL=1